MSDIYIPTSFKDALLPTAATLPFPTTIRGTVVDLDLNLVPDELPSTWSRDRGYSQNGSRTWLPHFASKDTVLDALSHTSRAKLNRKTIRVEKLPGNIYHPNYLSYLESCYANHWAPVVTPDILWLTLLNEIATIVRENEDALRDLFTFAKKGKTRILVQTGDPVVIPIHSVVSHLKNLVPVGVDQFLPTFTTSTETSRLAFAAAFCDVVSPYYSYGMMMCGFPRIVIQGTCDD